MQERGIQVRALLIATGLLLAFIGLGGRLSYLHLANHSRMNREYVCELLGRRGQILDCNGQSMAASIPARRFFVDPLAVSPKHDVHFIAQTVSQALKLPLPEVMAIFSPTNTSRYNVLCISEDDKAFALLSDKKKISGISSEDVMIRSNPQGRRMSHIIGFVNREGVGSGGLEQELDSRLRGAPGNVIGVADARRREIWWRRTEETKPIHGSDVYLTLDNNIQYVVEAALKEVVENFSALAGCSIVEEVNTGRILAMASYPDYNPAEYNRETKDVFRNMAIGVNYEPGSVMKGITISSALNERIITPSTLIDCGAGTWFYANKPLRDHATGLIDIRTVLQKSSNIASAKIGLMLGPRRIYSYFSAFGFGRKLGVDLPGEETGILDKDFQHWDKLRPTRLPIGQGVSVTALQMVNAYSAIANGGKVMKPYVVDRVVSPNGTVILTNAPTVLARPIRPEIAQKVREMMVSVTEPGGTGKRAHVPGYDVAGKTGTAQKSVPGGYSSTDYYATFVGMLPAGKPQVAILVSLDRPQPQHSGGYVAAPVFAKIASRVARYLSIPPDHPEELENQEAEPFDPTATNKVETAGEDVRD